ncbi:CBM35 domain-containing protein [Streptomyces sp. IB2014 016-6]|uniref:alpha-galactosidase D n=1 Tax=Streptomyces sp. IB2014 016-6 TaxID=2517818 RepID=UPI0011CB9CE4|nr:CBM35 domain-containing protein [Streptomyces sp. IB2014 016-6]TXL87877.1 carbohydrate-binding protein [Streptomyces sp. IB2014 016-6]
MRPPTRTAARTLRAALVLAVTAGLAVAVPTTARAQLPETATDQAPSAQSTAAVAEKPYMGWSSWSLQTTSYPGVNPNGNYSYLTEANVNKQTDALASKLKKYGYEYVNIDAGWWRGWDWTPEFDEYGRQKTNTERFPSGMKAVADRIHGKGLKAGIYLPVGLEKEGYGEGRPRIWNTDDCTTGDIVYEDLRTTNGWDSSYKIDFSKPCAQKYIDSQAQLIADWGYDFLKLDGVGPGSFKSGDNYDNRTDVAAWQKAIKSTGRPIHLEISWSLDINYAEDWKATSNGWRVDTDVECYCNTLVSWENSVEDRWRDTPGWTRYAGPGGWNDLDAINVGNAAMSGLTKAERQSYMTLWAVAKSPLYSGDDLTKLDDYGLSLMTNRDVLKINQQPGKPAKPISSVGDEQVWASRNPDGGYTVALFNQGDSPSPVTADWQALGFTGQASVRDVWNGESLGRHKDGITQAVPAHGSRLFTVTPQGRELKTTAYEAESPDNVLSGPASVADCDECSGTKKVGNLYVGGKVQFKDVVVEKAGRYLVKVAYTSGDPRSIGVSANGKAPVATAFPATGGWSAVDSISVPVTLKAGSNTVTFDSGDGYSPDIDKIDVPRL